MQADEQRSAFRWRLARMSDEKIRAKLPVWRPWKRELAEWKLAQIANSWSRELAEQVQLPPKERPKNWPAVAAIALVAAVAVGAFLVAAIAILVALGII